MPYEKCFVASIIDDQSFIDRHHEIKGLIKYVHSSDGPSDVVREQDNSNKQWDVKCSIPY